MEKRIAVIRGDGIGPEIVGEAINVLNTVAEKFGHSFTYDETLMGGCAIDACGDPFPQESLDKCRAADAVLLGAVGGPKWDGVPKEIRPERGLLRMRSALGLFANIRPTKLFPQMKDACPLKPEIADRGVDFVVVRELVGGVYFGEHRSEQINGQETATDIMAYTEEEIRRKQDYLKKMMGSKQVTLSCHDCRTSLIEAVLARGDRRLAPVLEYLVKKGGRLDAWTEFFSFERWQEAFAACGVDPDFYAARKREFHELLPWDFIDIGVTKEYLKQEALRSYRAQTTPNCKEQCTGCGASKLLGRKCDVV